MRQEKLPKGSFFLCLLKSAATPALVGPELGAVGKNEPALRRQFAANQS
jgi:hypothetical protein